MLRLTRGAPTLLPSMIAVVLSLMVTMRSSASATVSVSPAPSSSVPRS